MSGDELDKKDEAICPHDFATAGPITDDDIGAVLAGMPAGVNLDIFLDSCFSGTVTRVMMDTIVPGSRSVTARPFTVRFVEPPVDQSIFADAAGERDSGDDTKRQPRGGRRARSQSRSVVWMPGQ